MELDERSKYLRRIIIDVLSIDKRGHIGSSLSLIEILRTLFDSFLVYDPINPHWDERDRFILSKGHGCLALYAILADKGFFPKEDLLSFCKSDSHFGGHPERNLDLGIEATTGALGHGFSMAVGMAIAAKIKKQDHRVVVVMGDGEINEGSIWEAAMCASKHQLENLIAVVDYNKIQSYGTTKEVLDLEPLTDKWKSFGFEVIEVDGHNVLEIEFHLKTTIKNHKKPTVFICHTIKGKGLSFAENNPSWHHKSGLKQGLFDTEEGAARKAAQEWLSSREGATLTRGQLTGDIGTEAIEGTLKFTTGAKEFAEQQANVKKALEQGVNEVKNTLDTSEAFLQALKQGDPTQMTLGNRWQTAIEVADKEMKAKYRPIYEQVEKEGDGLLVDLTPLKTSAKEELDRLNKNKAMSSAAEDKRKVLEQILAQEDKISFSTAHDLRSDFLASARESVKEGVPATTLEAYYKKYAQGLRNNMDNIAVITFGSQEQKDAARRLGLVGGIDQPAGLRQGQFKEYNIDELSKLNLPTTEANAKMKVYRILEKVKKSW